MSKIKKDTILYGNDSRENLLRGSYRLYKPVSATLGAMGQNVVIKRGFHGQPQITKDGVTVARNVTASDVMEQGSIDILLRAAEKTNEEAGDGTSTSIVLAHNLFDEGYKKLKNRKGLLGNIHRVNSVAFQRGLNKALEVTISTLKEMSSMEFNPYDVARISANGDEEIAKLISEAFSKVGKDGIISIEESNKIQSHITKEEGLQIDNGLIHPFFATDPRKMVASYKKSLVVLIDAELEKATDIVYYIHKAKDMGMPLMVMAHDFGQEVINVFLGEKVKNGVPLLLVKAPFYGENRSAIINDLSKMTGATVLSERNNNFHKLGLSGSNIEKRKQATEKYLGAINKVESNSKTTSIQYTINEEYIEELKALYEETKDDFVKDRIAMLTGGVATINVGGYSSTEVKERLDRVEDAVNATRASLVNGIVAGGGIALLTARKAIKELTLERDERIGANTLYKVLASPYKKILSNAYISSNKKYEYPYGINVRTGQEVDMIKDGVIDPVNVTISALKNAVSVSATLLTSEAYILNLNAE